MFKYVVLRNTRRAKESFLANYCSKVEKNGTYDKLLLFNNANAKTYGRSTYSFAQPGSHVIKLYARIVWNRIFSRHVLAFPATMIACATGLALMKSYPSVPGICGFMSKDLSGRKALAAAPSIYYPTNLTLESYRQAKFARLTASIFSALKHFRLFVRAIYLAILFSPIIARALLLDFSDVESRKICLQSLIVTLEKAGPAFVTWAQWAATRPDLFPRDLCNELSKLQNKVHVHSFSYTKETIEKAFGRKLPEIFDDFEEVPIALGGVAQVHRATLRSQYPGKQDKPIVVAVKVRHPGIRELIQMDFAIIECFANILSFTSKFKWLKLNESLKGITGLMKSEVDLSMRADLLARLCINFRIWKYVSFPKPLFPLVHPAVLVETYEKGDSLSHFVDNNIRLNRKIKRAIVYAGTGAFIKMFEGEGYIFPGMHPGNILVRIDKGEPYIIFLDVGAQAEFSIREGYDLVALFMAVCRRDGRTAAECSLSLSNNQTCPDPNVFVEEVEESFSLWDSKEGGYINPHECMLRLLEKVRQHEVNIGENVCTVIRSILDLEDWQWKLYAKSNKNVMHTFAPNLAFQALE